MFLRFEENANCGFVDDRVWMEEGVPRTVDKILRARNGQDVWCPIIGLNEKGEAVAAQAVKVQDSGEGTCWLVFGGLWGLRLKEPGNSSAWSLDDAAQWGEGFLLLPATGDDLHFA